MRVVVYVKRVWVGHWEGLPGVRMGAHHYYLPPAFHYLQCDFVLQVTKRWRGNEPDLATLTGSSLA